MQLVTIPFSHFCEKGRWGLDRAEIPYRELQFAPVMQRIAVMPLGSLTVPVLINAPRVIRGSSEILRFADPSCAPEARLYPTDRSDRAEVEKLVERFDLGIAPDIRLFLYSWATEDSSRLGRVAIEGLPSNQKLIMRAGLPVIAKVLRQHFKIKPGTQAQSADAVTREFDAVSEMLADGRKYLVGDRFSAADLAFAAFTAAFIGVAGYGGDQFKMKPIPEEVADQSATWAATPAGQWVAEIYREHRSEKRSAVAAAA